MYIVYITTNLKNQKVYFGVHEQSEPYEFDGYLGSGKRMRQAIKQVICVYPDKVPQGFIIGKKVK